MLEKLKQLANFASGADGEVKTYFDGRITQSQLIVGIIAIVAVLFILKFVKSIAKLFCTIAIVCVCLVQFGLATPDQLVDIAGKMKDTGMAYYEKVATASENIKLTDGNLSFRIGDKWINASDIKSVVSGKENTLTVITGTDTLTIDDKTIIEVLKTLTKK